MKNLAKQKNNTPPLRFPGFSGEWEEKRLGNFLVPELRKVSKPNKSYLAIGIRSHFKGTFHKPGSDPGAIAMEELYEVKHNDFIVNITFAWEGALAIAKKEDEGGLVSHRFPTYVFDAKITTAEYFRQVFPTKRMKYLLGVVSPGGAGRNRVLDKKDFLKLKVNISSLSEQQKIASFLTAVDEWIRNLREQKEGLEKYKKGAAQKIFSQAENWEEKRLGNCLDYEQPTEYIVKNTEYDDSYKTPVLTAGKSFILGYTNEADGIFENNLPVIIFDDFTTTSQFVNFPFKVKSSAMKILKAKNNFDIRFIYAAMQLIKYEIGGHGRHWISKYSNLKISVPKFEEQQKIAEFLTVLDNLIESKQKQITLAEKWKKGLMQGLFV